MRHAKAAFLVLALLAASSSIPAVAQQTIRLTAATGIAPTVPTAWWFSDYIGPKLKEYSNGRIVPNVKINGTLCNEHKCVEQARLGQIDIGSVSGGNIGSFGHTFDILNLPYIFKDDASAEKLIGGWLGDELRKRAEKEMGLHVLAIIPSYSFRNVDNSKREIRVPKDMQGIKFRVTKTEVEFTLVKTWGGTPVPYDWGQLYEGLQTNVVDGMYIPDAYVAAQKFYEVAPYITRTGGGWNAHIIFMDLRRYQRLPDSARAVVDRIGREIAERSFKVDAEWLAKYTKELAGKVKVYEPNAHELQLWYEGAPPAWRAVRNTYDPALARRALEEQGQQELIGKLEKAGAL
jgi:TRAP-type C4-dicarboxylate transport system substrate-binding protein